MAFMVIKRELKETRNCTYSQGHHRELKRVESAKTNCFINCREGDSEDLLEQNRNQEVGLPGLPRLDGV